jgi:hypothetical protein
MRTLAIILMSTLWLVFLIIQVVIAARGHLALSPLNSDNNYKKWVP